MKKFSFWAAAFLALSLLTGCSKDDSNETDTKWKPGSILGEWVFRNNEIFEDGKLVEKNQANDPADKCVAIFNADGTFRYYDFPPEVYYDGTYTYDEASGRLIMDGDGITAAFADDTMRWTYDEEEGCVVVEYYVRK